MHRITNVGGVNRLQPQSVAFSNGIAYSGRWEPYDCSIVGVDIKLRSYIETNHVNKYMCKQMHAYIIIILLKIESTMLSTIPTTTLIHTDYGVADFLPLHTLAWLSQPTNNRAICIHSLQPTRGSPSTQQG